MKKHRKQPKVFADMISRIRFFNKKGLFTMAVRDFDFQNNLFIDDSKTAQRVSNQKKQLNSLRLEEKKTNYTANNNKKTSSNKKKNNNFPLKKKKTDNSHLKMSLIISAIIIFATASVMFGAFSKRQKEFDAKFKENVSKEKKLKFIDQKVSSVFTKSIQALRKGDQTEAMLLLKEIPAIYENEEELVYENYTASQRMKADLLVSGMLQNTAQKLSSAKEESSNKQWDILEKKLMQMRKTYAVAQEYFSKGDFNNAKRNYLNVLTEFEEIENANNQLLKIEERANNAQAKPLYEKAMKLLQNGGNEKEAASVLSQMLIVAPLSDYTEFAAKKLEELVKKPQVVQYIQNIESTKNVDNASAKDFQNAANKALQKNHYAQARTLYASAINQTDNEKIIQECTAGIIQATEKELANEHHKNFMKHCDLFRDALDKNDYPTARKEYFNALQNAFAPYMDNSLTEFITAENHFVKSFEKYNSNPDLSEIRREMEAEYQQALKLQEEQLRIKFNKQIEDLNNEKEILINAYETQLDLQKNESEKAIINIAKGRLRERREKQEIINKLEKELENKNAQIAQLEQALKDLEINSARKSLEELNKLQASIDELEKNLSMTEKSRASIQNGLNQQKMQIKELQNSLAVYEKELAAQKLALENKDKIITEKNDEIASLQKNIEGLKVEIEAQELFYKKALGTANYNQKALEEKYIALQQQQVELLEKQETLQENLEHARNQNALLAQEAETWKYKYEKLPEEMEKRFSNQLEEEKFKMRSEYNEKLNRIENDITEGKTGDLSEMKQIAKIIEILNDNITFQLNNQNLSSLLKKNDRLEVIRDLGGNLITIGTLKITNVSPFSTFGRANIEKLSSGMSLRTGDILIITE